MASLPARAQAIPPIPGAADVNRVKPEDRSLLPAQNEDQSVTVPSRATTTEAPAGAKNIHLILRDMHVLGAAVFSPAQVRTIYAPYIGHNITLNQVYEIADAITKHYRDAGYFLSLAYVPVQHIKDGIVTIQVVEGYVGTVELPENIRDHYVVREYISRLTAEKPLTSEQLESFLLRLNDLPGYSFRAVLSSVPKDAEGVIKLTLVPTPKSGQGIISFDNYSSRFLGPNELTGEYSTSLLPLQQTTISALASLPVDKLKYATLEHAITIAPDLILDLSGNYTKAHPGFTLEPEDVRSKAAFLSGSLIYQALRQRQENLSFKIGFDGRNTTTKLLDTLFTKDHIRALRLNASYDRADNWQGSNSASVTVSRGIHALNSSDKGDPDLSRSAATPTFTKAELTLSRLQGITPSWSAFFSADGQLSANPLFSSEQFGYGGQAFGRAYDPSDITGDNGINGSIELRYNGLDLGTQVINLAPYAFYDIGTIWNRGDSQSDHQSGSSAGVGVRAATNFGLSGNLGLAMPLTRQITNPVYGGDHTGPRLLLQVSQGF